MKRKQKPIGNPESSDAILQRGGLTPEQIKQGRMTKLAEDAQFANAVVMAIVTAGGEVLRSEYGFTQEQAAAWAQVTIAKAQGYVTAARGK